MRMLTLSAALAALVLVGAGAAEAKSCLKGAIVGGLGGKMVGHGKAGAAVGCAVGHHRANKKS